MSVSRPLLLGLGGLALLGVVQWVILPAFEYRADNASRAERARQRHLSMQLLTDDYARLNGAASVAISDMEAFPLSVAVRLGADAAFKAADPALADLANGCEACFEASGSVGGMNTCLRSAAPGGTVVHVGFLGEEEVAYPVNTMVIRKEVTVCGSLRAYQEFPLAARLVESGRLDLSPLITASYPLEKAEEAILAASDKTRSMKVVLTGPAL